MQLTEGQHRQIRAGVRAGFAAIHRAATEVSETSNANQLIIACSHRASQTPIMLRYGALQWAVGEDVRMRILTYHNYVQNLPADPIADILLT